MPGIEILPMNNALVVKDAVAQEADIFQIVLSLLAFVKTFRQVGEHEFECSGKKGRSLFVVGLEEAGPEAELEFRHNPAGCDGFARFCDFGFCLGDLIRRPWRKLEAWVVIPVVPPHEPGGVPMDGVAKGNLTKLQRGIQALAQGHVEQVAGKSGARIGAARTLTDGIGAKSFSGKTKLEFLEKCCVHGFTMRIFPKKTL